MKRKVTIRDVAYLAGVSISTVSRVVSNKVNVNESTRQKVQKAIDQTGYEPNYTARALATKNTDTIAVIIDRSPTLSLGNSFFIDSLEAISTKLNEYKKDILLVFSEANYAGEHSKVKSLIQSNKIDGVIKLSVQKDDETIKYLVSTGIPTVVIGRPDEDVLYVNNDNTHAMKEATEYLISQGGKKIAFVGGNSKLVVTFDREQGFREALDKADIYYDDSYIYYEGFTIESGYKIADTLIENNFDSVACTDDLIAYGIAKRYNEKGKKIRIISFNNTLLSEFSPIPISSVDIDAKKLGKEAVELLLSENNNKKHSIIDTNIIFRS
ncbi:LacI family DNA-binding transcriptional regulator [Helcococcus kunzii]|uniref:LacI family DNA-binding transcriptional regulator n=1 Tax=Helcococcus kunzii TaxID=40091 RepID=UPI0024ADF568|nr:LacI family DNA-binding transcriptional regulator [Helcococcus kunzii]